MSVNVYKQHVLVLPEDDANRQLANGFLLEPRLNLRPIQILPIVGGWAKLRDELVSTHLSHLHRYPDAHLVLLIDFDEKVEERLRIFKESIPVPVCDRVYLLGTLDEPEPLRKDQGITLEKIGAQLAKECAHEEMDLWTHKMLVHNRPELERLIGNVKPFLFNCERNG